MYFKNAESKVGVDQSAGFDPPDKFNKRIENTLSRFR